MTDKFKDISKEIIEIKKKLDTHHSDTNLGNLIGRVQVQIIEISWLVGWLFHWFMDWFMDWFIDWFID